MPPGFTWVDKPLLAALSLPQSAEDLVWLRRHGIDILISLSEDPPPRRWINDSGLMAVHVPITDFSAPSFRQLELCTDTIAKAHKSKLGVAIHCNAGKGRTGTILAAFFVTNGMNAKMAINKVRKLRPGSVETEEQENAIQEFAKQIHKAE